MKRVLLLMMFSFVLLVGCKDQPLSLGDEPLVYSVCNYQRFGADNYLLFSSPQGEISKQIKLGHDVAASISYVEPYLFIPCHIKIDGFYVTTNSLYYVDTRNWSKGRLRVDAHPQQVLPYRGQYLLLSADNGISLSWFDQDLKLVRKANLLAGTQQNLEKNAMLFGDRLFFVATGKLMYVDLDKGFEARAVALSGQNGWISLARWGEKLVASDRRRLWLVDPEQLLVESVPEFSYQGERSCGSSLVIGDSLLLGDTCSKQVVLFNLRERKAMQITLERETVFISNVEDRFVVSHHDGITAIDSKGVIVETKSINGRFLSNIIKLPLIK